MKWKKKGRDEYVKEKKYRIAGGPSSHMFLGIMVANVRKKAGKEGRKAGRQAGRQTEVQKRKEVKERKKKERGWRSQWIAKQKIRGDRLSGARSYD